MLIKTHKHCYEKAHKQTLLIKANTNVGIKKLTNIAKKIHKQTNIAKKKLTNKHWYKKLTNIVKKNSQTNIVIKVHEKKSIIKNSETSL